MTLKTFFANSVIFIPIITFLIGIILNNYYLIMLTLGLLISLVLNFMMKVGFSQLSYESFRRPVGSKGCSIDWLPLKGGHDHEMGFPSGHSQFIWFFVTFLILYHLSKSNTSNYILIILLIIFALLVSISRLGIYPVLGNLCHTRLQVIVGCFIGIISALIYFIIISNYRKYIKGCKLKK
jgi:membrane-associated phospholipid phosphatase